MTSIRCESCHVREVTYAAFVGGKLDDDLVPAIDVGQVRAERAVQDSGVLEVGGHHVR
jgi:hypothetical protein